MSTPERGEFLARHGATLIDNGFHIIPIPPGTKGPKENGWQNIRSTKPLLQKWLKGSSWNHGVGILTKHFPAVDIDVLDPVISQKMVEWVQENIGHGLVRIGKAPKTLLMFSTRVPFKKVTSARYYNPHAPKQDPEYKGQRVEILGDGQQFVAYHIHPETDRPYTWPNAGENPIDTPAFELVEITEVEAVDIAREFERLVEAAGWERLGNGSQAQKTPEAASDSDAMAEIPPPDETPSEVARVKSALDAIDPSKLDYDGWFAIVAALKWTRWACAEQLAHEWSEKSDKHTDEHFYRTWKGAQKRNRGREFTLGTVFHNAKEAGWEHVKETTVKEELDALATLMEEIDFFSEEVKANAKFFKRVVDANLSITNTEAVLVELKKQTGVNLPILRKELAEARKPDLDGELPTHAGYAQSFIKMLKASCGVDPVGVAGNVYVFDRDKGIWEGRMAAEYSVEIAKKFDGQEKCERRSDYTQIAAHTYDLCAKGNDEFFLNAPVGLACEGRFYKVAESGEIEKETLTSRHRQRMLSPHRPVVGEMPKFKRLLDDAFAGDQDGEQIELLQEIWGAMMLGFMFKYEKAVLFKGVGRSGKGTILKLMEATVPANMRAAISPFKWDNEYYVAALANKRLNVVGELPDELPMPAAIFKWVIGRDQITGRNPTHKPFTFTNESTHIFSSNHFIHTRDHTEAFYGRWLLLHFRNSRLEIKGGININLAKEIIENEMSAITAWALQGAKRLLARGEFKETKAQTLLMESWRHRTSTLLEFLLDGDECKLVKDGYTRRKDFYTAYAQWCRESNRRPVGKQKLYDDLEGAQVAKLGVFKKQGPDGSDRLKGIVLKSVDHLAFYDEDDEEL